MRYRFTYLEQRARVSHLEGSPAAVSTVCSARTFTRNLAASLEAISTSLLDVIEQNSNHCVTSRSTARISRLQPCRKYSFHSSQANEFEALCGNRKLKKRFEKVQTMENFIASQTAIILRFAHSAMALLSQNELEACRQIFSQYDRTGERFLYARSCLNA